MPPKNIVVGQNIDPEKAQRARELRRSMTAAEKLLWQHLRAHRVDGWHFRRQQVIAGYIVDFYCHAAALVIEVDGAVHDSQAEYDQERDQVLQQLGLRVMRFKNPDVLEDLDSVLERIRHACRGEETSPPAPLRRGEG